MVSYIFILTQDLNNLIVDVLQSQFELRSKAEIFNLTATVSIKITDRFHGCLQGNLASRASFDETTENYISL